MERIVGEWKQEHQERFRDRDGNDIVVTQFSAPTSAGGVVFRMLAAKATIQHKGRTKSKTYKGEGAHASLNRWIHDNTLHLIH